ncbi:MAG: Tol-Pal system beta propeller repeat protein TolB [Candidatus Alcyoniella australis]|nr:Tol-Pal system beta propeller repeat protein TolB [Candidatus Alcyoniella australis]
MNNARFARKTVFILCMALLLLTPLSAEARFTIDFINQTLDKIPVAVPEFYNMGTGANNGDLAQQATQIMVDDLHLSGYFSVRNPALYIEDRSTAGITPETIDFYDWKLINAELLIKAGFTVSEGKLTMELRLYDVFNGSLMLGKTYQGRPEDYPEMVHRFGNEIVYLVTGQEGIFGTKVVFLRGTGDNQEIYTVGIDGRNLTRITANNVGDLSPVWDSAGERIYYVSYLDGTTKIYSVSAEGGRPKLAVGYEGLNATPSISPNGKRMAMTLSKDGNSEIYTSNLDGRALRRLTASWSIEVSPCWSPEGNELVFISDRSGTPQVYKMADDGSEVRRLTFEGGYNQTPEWSPTGDKICYSGRSMGTYDIFVMNADGSYRFNLTEGVGSNEDPSWSPDGRAIVFSSTRGGRGRTLWIMNIDGSYTKQLTTPGGFDTSPSWAPRLLK